MRDTLAIRYRNSLSQGPLTASHYSAIFYAATPDFGNQSSGACGLCLEHRGFLPVVHGELAPRGDWSTGVPIDLACGLCLLVALGELAGCDWSRGVLADCDWSPGVLAACDWSPGVLGDCDWSPRALADSEPTKHQSMCVCVYVCLCVCVCMCGPIIFVENQQKHQHKVGNLLYNFIKPYIYRPKWNQGKPPFARWAYAPKRPLRSTSCKRIPSRAIWFRRSRTPHTFGATLGAHTWPRFPVSHHSSTTSMSTAAWRRRI